MEGVSELWEQLEASPLLLWVAGVLALFLAVGIIKRVLIISVVSGVLLLLYFIYVTNFQERFPLPEIDLEEIQERWDSGDEANASAEVSP